jgi:hypothetical protein
MSAVFAALEDGRIDQNKAWVFVDTCADLTSEQAKVVCQRLLPFAQRLTTGQLAARIKKLAIALDPEWGRLPVCHCGTGAQRDRVSRP